MDFSIKKGLDIPMEGSPEGEMLPFPTPSQVALCFDPFEEQRFKLLVKVGDPVKIGTPLAMSKTEPPLMFVSPGGGTVSSIVRGEKRRLCAIVVELGDSEEKLQHEPIILHKASGEEILERLRLGGALAHLRARPFNRLVSPLDHPRDIFVQAIASAPFAVPFELQVAGREKEFQIGLDALGHLTEGQVHLVHHKDSGFAPFCNAQGVSIHRASGPHPIGNPSVHIHKISPIRSVQDVVWTLTALDCVIIGSLISKGEYPVQRIVSIAGNGILPHKRRYYEARAGLAISDCIADRIINDELQLISGDPLSGHGVSNIDFMGFDHTAFCSIPKNQKRESFHFFRIGGKKYTATKAYLSGHRPPPPYGYSFTTNQHGEERPFIDARVYRKVMPMRIPTMFLIKAVLAEDFELAEQLGLLEVAPEDFALPAFICPSKIDMISIIKKGLVTYSREVT